MTKSSTRILNRTLLFSNLRRFWPGSALMLIVYIIVSLMMYNDVSSWNSYMDYRAQQIGAYYLTSVSGALYSGLFACVAGFIAALLCFRYLMKHREAVMVHSLPIRRETQLVTSAASGIILFGAPIILGGLMFYSAFAVKGFSYPLQAMHWVAVNLTVAFFTFGITSFFAFLTGNSIAHGILTLIFINLPLMVEFIINEYCHRFLLGFTYSDLITLKINPIYYAADVLSKAAQAYRDVDIFHGVYFRNDLILQNMLYSLLVFIAGLVFLFLGALLYRRRNIETAGDVIAIPLVRPIFRYGAAFGLAAMFGSIYSTQVSYYSYSAAWELVFSILGGALGFFAAEMFIRRTIHVFKRYMGAIGFALVFSALFLVLYFDLPGYGSMALDKNSVELIAMLQYNPRVKIALLGEPLNFYGTMADLSIDDPGGYLEGRGYMSDYTPNGRVPQAMAQQILEQDETVMRGEDAQTAMALQAVIAGNAMRFSECHLARLYPSLSMNANYSHYSIPFIARYTNGRVVKREYSVWVNNVAINDTNSPEADFLNIYHEVELINEAAYGRVVKKCADNANYLQLDFPNTYHDYQVGILVPAATDSQIVSDKLAGDTKRIVLNRGEWDGLYEAFLLDTEAFLLDPEHKYGAEGYDRLHGAYGSKRDNQNGVFAYGELTMPDNYRINTTFYDTDINVLNWFMQKYGQNDNG